MKKLLFVLIMVIWAFIGLQCPVSAQISFPIGSVTIWVGHAAGGSTDIITRALAAGAEKSLWQKISIINKPGAAGTVCASILVKEKPDGYILAAFPDPPIARSPHLRDLDYDPFQDLSFIIRVGKWKNIFAVRADSPFKKWSDVVDWAKKNPGQLTFGHPGAATAPNFAMIRIAKKEGFTYKNVPFIGDAPTVSALLGGHVMISGISAVIGRSHLEAKTIRILLTYEREGLDYAPDVLTF
jgi:tripartite-type tricarboxylate transporter receptor subunit TctC